MFDPFEWAKGVLTTGNDFKKIAFATAVVFGALIFLQDAGLPNMTFLAVLIGFGVLLVRRAS